MTKAQASTQATPQAPANTPLDPDIIAHVDDQGFVWIRPKPDRIVLSVFDRALSLEGEGVRWSPWWQRRLNDGDIELIDQPAALAGKE